METKPGFVAQIKSYPATFWVANTMEIFERLSWYGWFTVMPLYVTAPVATGGLGFTTEVRGVLQAIVPFILYLLPVLTGALADRFGFKRMFTIAYLVMIVSYYALGQFKTFPTFFSAFMFVAIGAAIFKPVVVGTVARVTNEFNSATGFGIFYMMVNVGGFVGPIVAGMVRGWDWKWVFVACSAWALVNLIIVTVFYKDPPIGEEAQRKARRGSVIANAVEVLGNGRFFVTVGVVLIALMLSGMFSGLGYAWFSWWYCLVFIVGWVALNFLYDQILPAGSAAPAAAGEPRSSWIVRRMHCSNWRFALFLLIMSGFWTSFNQIFYTMPEYIRDFTETRPLINAVEAVFGKSDPDDPDKGVAARVATVNADEREVVARTLYELTTADAAGRLDQTILAASARRLAANGVQLSTDALRQLLAQGGGDVAAITRQAVRQGAAAASNPARREAIVTTIRELAAVAADTSLDDEAQAKAFRTGARQLWARDLLLPATTIRELIRNNEGNAEQIADEAIAAYRREIIAQLVELHALRRLELPLLESGAHELLASKVRLTPKQIEELVRAGDGDVEAITNRAIIQGRQFNPEFIVNIDAGAIVLFQVVVSFLMGRFHRFTTMVAGMLVAALGIGLSAFAGGQGMLGPGSAVWCVAGGILVFAFGEMMASPTSQEYVGRVAPEDKKALYMGYYFVAVALGNLFGGILSGQMYGKLARDMQRPDIMWLVFGGLMAATALIFVLYNKLALPRHGAHELTPDTSA